MSFRESAVFSAEDPSIAQVIGATTIVSIEQVALTGSEYDDQLTGGAYRDFLSGESGDDELSGLAGDDWLFGGGGNDIIIGGSGKDVLSGGSDYSNYPYVDIFVFGPNDSRPGGDVRDKIIDFQPGVDKLHVAALGITSFSQISFKALGTNGLGGMIVYGDPEGDGVDWDDFGVHLVGVTSLAAGDFIFA